MNRRTTRPDVFTCPICNKKPYMHTFGVNTAWMECCGYGIHRHKKISVVVPYAQPSDLFNELIEK